jgi:hypothetical protein
MSGNKIYEGVAEYGKIRALIASLVVTFIGIIGIVIGLYLILKKESYDTTITGTVTKSVCKPAVIMTSKNKPTNVNNCDINVSYVVAGKTYEKSFVSQQSSTISVGSSMDIDYESVNPTNARIHEFNKKYIGFIIITTVTFILAISWVSYYFTRKSTAYAAATGSMGLGSDVLSIGRSITR